MATKRCQKCGRVFEGRANKSYCSSNCKSAMNNNRVAERDKDALIIEQKIKANRRILRSLHNLYGEVELPSVIIEKTALDFQYNNGRTTQVNSLIILDYKIFKLTNNNYKISKTA